MPIFASVAPLPLIVALLIQLVFNVKPVCGSLTKSTRSSVSWYERLGALFKHRGDGCIVGNCIEISNCSGTVLKPTGYCAVKQPGDWVCCKNVTTDTIKTIPQTSTQSVHENPGSNKSNLGNMTESRNTDREPQTRGRPRYPHGSYDYNYDVHYDYYDAHRNRRWRNPNVSVKSSVDRVASTKKDGCVAGSCTRENDCDSSYSVAIVATGNCRTKNRRNEAYVCCYKSNVENKKTQAVNVDGEGRTTENSGWKGNTNTRPSSSGSDISNSGWTKPDYSGCGLREGYNMRWRRSRDKRSSTSFSDGHHVAISAAVVGGKEAKPFSWPWVAALFKETPGRSNSRRFLCAGSLIGDSTILTAAHVFTSRDIRQPSVFIVTLGTHIGTASVGEYRVQSILLHPRYQARYYYNDIALLRLEHPVTFNRYVMPVCLPDQNRYSEDSDLLGKSVTVIGWGDDAYGGKSSRVLKEATFPVLSRSKCNAAYIKVESRKFPRGITDEMLCAASPQGGVDACQGDSGGPLMIPKGHNWIQIGLVSFGYRCGDPQYPGVYTKVAKYVDWIKQNANLYQF